MTKSLSFAIIAASLFLTPKASCQWKQQPTTGSPENRLPDRTTLAGQSGLSPLFTARLVDESKNAKQHRAVIEVQTDGVELVDSAHTQPKLDQAHIQYRLDDGSVQNSSSSTFTFENLSKGEHRIYVTLASNDNRPIGKQTTLKVRIP